MECQDVRDQLLAYQRGRVSEDVREGIAAHLAECGECRRAADAEAGLSRALVETLPRHAAPAGLKQRLAERVAAAATGTAPATSTAPASIAIAAARPVRRGRLRRYAAPIASALAAAAIVLFAVRLTQPGFLRASVTTADLVDEGVNDHLRVVASAHPVEIESGGIHQVKPWFTGRLDFAPRVSFSGDAEFALAGGSVGYFRDRKAAVFVWKARLHTISLFVFRAEGLPWPTRGLERVGRLEVAATVSRGFNVLMWRDGELGYCLVSDVNRADLDALATRVAATD